MHIKWNCRLFRFYIVQISLQLEMLETVIHVFVWTKGKVFCKDKYLEGLRTEHFIRISEENVMQAVDV